MTVFIMHDRRLTYFNYMLFSRIKNNVYEKDGEEGREKDQFQVSEIIIFRLRDTHTHIRT
jgi:hypothetical protein